MDLPQQEQRLATILGKDLNVRQTEDLVRQLARQPRTQPRAISRAAEETDLEDRLREGLATKVNLKRSRRGRGTIIIHFYSDEELNTLTDLLLGG